MKNVIFFIFLFAVVITAQEKKAVFASKEEAIESYNIGTFQYYIPTYLSGHKKLSGGEEIVSFPQDASVRMDVVGGNFWTIQKAGTKFVSVDGIIVRRWDCGNKITFFEVLPPPVTQTSLAFKPGEYGRGGDNPPIQNLQISVDNDSFPWPTLIVATLTAVIGYLAYLVVNRYYDSQRTGGPPVVNTLPTSAKIVFGFGGRIDF